MWWFLALFLAGIEFSEPVRVCKTFPDYENPYSTHCFNNPIDEYNATEILWTWGCTVEEYSLTTDDGYQILVIRAYKTISKNTPIIMTHGMTGNCLCFLSMHNKTIAYNLLQSGYQLFLINFRGTKYNKRHAKYTQDDREYWKFSWDQMAKYDLPTSLDLVSSITGQKSIIVGISLGSLVAFSYASLFPNEASQKLKGIISISHVTTMRYSTSAAKWVLPYWKYIKPLLELFWHGRFLPRYENVLNFCSSGTAQINLCLSILGPILGYDPIQTDPLHAPVTIKIVPDATSLNLIDHVFQLMNTGVFQQYDYGKIRNLLEYGTTRPPIYNSSKINVPVAIFPGINDKLGSVKDAREFYGSLAIKARCGFKLVPYQKWTHTDVVLAKNVNTTLNPLVYSTIKQMENYSCS